jgi:hypothetical protein
VQIIDSDQGVCPDGHDCYLILPPRGNPLRTCGQAGGDTHLAEGDRGNSTYVGWPLIAEGVTLDDIDEAQSRGEIDDNLAHWARSSARDRE